MRAASALAASSAMRFDSRFSFSSTFFLATILDGISGSGVLTVHMSLLSSTLLTFQFSPFSMNDFPNNKKFSWRFAACSAVSAAVSSSAAACFRCFSSSSSELNGLEYGVPPAVDGAGAFAGGLSACSSALASLPLPFSVWRLVNSQRFRLFSVFSFFLALRAAFSSSCFFCINGFNAFASAFLSLSFLSFLSFLSLRTNAAPVAGFFLSFLRAFLCFSSSASARTQPALGTLM